MTRRYFAYGSNLDVAQMAGRCPHATVEGTATLPGYRFLINSRGVATVVSEPGSAVHGLLWAVSPSDLAALDRYEGVRAGLYSQRQVSVRVGGTAEDAILYVASDSTRGTPRPDYLESILRCAHELEFEQAYIAELEAAAVAGP